MAKAVTIKWFPKPKAEDYDAARAYLSLLFSDDEAARCARKLSKAEAASYEAKDLFRASRLPLLDSANSHVEKDRRKIGQGKALSPLLLIRDEVNRTLIVADGYHRLCAVYSYDEDAVIPCRIVSRP